MSSGGSTTPSGGKTKSSTWPGTTTSTGSSRSSRTRKPDSAYNALRREDEKQHMAGNHDVDWFVPIVADAEAGFGGPLHAFDLMKAMIEAGAAGVHFEDQLAAAKKCGHLGGKVVVPTPGVVQKLVPARLAA